MCRWLAYSGSPLLIEELLYRPDHSLIDQSLHSRLGVETTNGDGFGLGWYAPILRPPPSSTQSNPHGTTATSERSPHTSNHRCSWPTSVPLQARRFSRLTATLSVTAGGCGSTTASSGTSIA